MPSSEKTLWTGSSSQVVNFKLFVLSALFCWLIIPIFIALWRYLETRTRKYEVTSERIRLTSGVLSRRTDDFELYRVKDSTLEQPFFLRLFGLSTLSLRTSDATHP